MNLRKLRFALLLYAAIDLFFGGICGGFLDLTPLMAAQFTTVTGTVTDPNGLPYANGTISALLVISGSPTLSGFPYTPPTQAAGLSSTGAFVMQLADNTQLLPGGSQWSFTVCSAGATVQPAIGKGPVCFTVGPLTISGASQSITAQLTAAAPALAQPISAGSVGATTYTSAFAGLASAITGVAGGGIVYVDTAQSLPASTLSITAPNLTVACTSPTVALTYATASRIQPNAQNFTMRDCNLKGPDLVAGNPPIQAGATGDASGLKLLNLSINGFGSTGGNGTIDVLQASHVEVAGIRAGDQAVGNSCTVSTASWAAPVAGTMFGLETITFAASGACAVSFPSDIAVNNAILCKGMTPIGYNSPGDGQSSYFGVIVSAAYPSITVQQLENPGTYVSGGTCQAGVGNLDWDILVNTQVQQTDLSIHDNDVSEVLVHNQVVGGSFAGVKFISNHLHPGMNAKAENGFEIGDFSGQNAAEAQNAHAIVSANNTCKMVSDFSAACYSYSIAEDVTETGNNAYSGGHTYSVQMDENAGVINCTITGGTMNLLGGGPGEDLNRTSNCTVTGQTILYPSATTSGINWGVSNGGVGVSAIPAASNNTVHGNTIRARVDICSTAPTAPISCGAQILQVVGNGATATVTFQPGVVNPSLFATESVTIQGNTQGAFNGTFSIASVIGGGTGFTFASATSATGTKGVAFGAGLTNSSGTTAIATLQTCPGPFKVNDTLWVSQAGATNYNVTAGSVTAITQLSPCTITYTIGTSGNAVSGGGIASQFSGKLLWLQENIASGFESNNSISGNNLFGPGSVSASSVCFAQGNSGATVNNMDRNQYIGNKATDCGNLFTMGNTGNPQTNTKIELGSTTNMGGMVASWSNGATIADDSSNPLALIGTGTGTCTSSQTLFLYNLGSNAATTCTNTTETQWQVAKHAGTVEGLFCTSTANGVSGVVTVRDNSTNKAVTCSLTGAQSCNDTTHSFAVVAGDLLDIQVATGAAETLANVKCKYYLWYQDN